MCVDLGPGASWGRPYAAAMSNPVRGIKNLGYFLSGFALATAAEEAEKAGHDDARRGDRLARLEALLAEVRGYIDGWDPQTGKRL